jgi:hypothetical protein
MKILDYILTFVIVGLIAYYFLFPNVEIIDESTHTTDTTEIVINKEKFDSLKYEFKAELERVKKTKIKIVVNNTTTPGDVVFDTLYIDTTENLYSANFNVGDSVLGTTGIVSFDMKHFKLFNINYRYPERVTTITDSVKTVYRERLTHGVQVGAGYGLINGKFDVFLGYGFQLNF